MDDVVDFHAPFMVQTLDPYKYGTHWEKAGPLQDTLDMAHGVWRDLLDAPLERYPKLYRVVNIDTKDVCLLAMRTHGIDDWGDTVRTTHILKGMPLTAGDN